MIEGDERLQTVPMPEPPRCRQRQSGSLLDDAGRGRTDETIARSKSVGLPEQRELEIGANVQWDPCTSPRSWLQSKSAAVIVVSTGNGSP